MIDYFNPADAPPPGAFSRATRANGFVFVSGTGAGNDIGGAPRAGTAAEETCWALDNVAAILRAAGSSMDRVVQVTMLITDPADDHEINAEYVKRFPGDLLKESNHMVPLSGYKPCRNAIAVHFSQQDEQTGD